MGELEANQWVVEDLREELHSAVENLVNLEDRVEDLAERQRQQAERIDALEDELAVERERSAELEERLEALEGLFSDHVIEGKRAHTAARDRDPREVVERGETHDLYVEEVNPMGPRPQAVGHIQGLVIFVDLGGPDDSVEEGNMITVEITDHGESHAEARLVEEVSNNE